MREAVCVVEKLLQHTTYRVRVRSVNRYGKSQWTTRQLTTILFRSPPPPPELGLLKKL